MKHLLRFLVALPLLLTSLTACIQADELPSTPRGDFEALWKIIDEHYCFFDYKHQEYGLDWNEVHRRYAVQISDSMSKEALFQVLSNLCSELRDGHVNLWTPFNTARYTQWYEAYPTNFDDSLQRVVLGPADEHRTASGLQYKVLPGNVGYIRCSSFNTAIGEGNLHEILRYFALCNALIVDIRSNGGGSGLPFSSELPGGWSIRFSASPTLDVNGQHTEFGIAPDVRSHLGANDRLNGKDSMIETAVHELRARHDSLSKAAALR